MCNLACHISSPGDGFHDWRRNGQIVSAFPSLLQRALDLLLRLQRPQRALLSIFVQTPQTTPAKFSRLPACQTNKPQADTLGHVCRTVGQWALQRYQLQFRSLRR